MQWLAEICIRRPVFASVLTLLIVVLGIAGYSQLGLDRYPRIDLPVVVVTTVLPGGSPEDIETDVTDPIEAAVNTLGGIDELRSVTSEGVSIVMIRFVLERDPDQAIQEVQSKIATIIRDLPDDIEQPVIQKIDPDAAPVVYLVLQGQDASRMELTTYADQVVRHKLETVNGVGQVSILGGQKREIRVMMNPVSLRAVGMPPSSVQQAIATQNLSVPGGALTDGHTTKTVRVLGKITDPADFAQIPLRLIGDRAVLVSDVARVVDGPQEAETAALLEGDDTVVLTVRKQSGVNTVKVADDVKYEVDEIRKRLPAGYTLEIVRDDSLPIRTSTHAVTEHLILGAIFAAIVVLLFLGDARSTVIAALAIPTSVLGTLAVISWLGYTLNSITLLALALCVGIVIDDAIVVLENIVRHMQELGKDPKTAAVEGTDEIGFAVLATTLSLIAVFLPVIFLAGIPGRFLRQFGVTMAVAVAVSMFVSFTLTPMLASRWLKPEQHKGSRLAKVVDVFYRPIERVYLKMLAWSLHHRWAILLACAGSMALTVPFGMMAKKGFLPVDDQGRFEVGIRLPEGAALEQTALVSERIAREIRELPEVVTTLVTVGDDDSKTPNLGRIYIALSAPETRVRTEDEIKQAIREQILPSLPREYRTFVAAVDGFGGSGQQTARIQYQLMGSDLDVLAATADKITDRLKQVPGAVDVDTDLIVGKPELGLRINRALAADLGVSVASMAQTLRLFVNGDKTGAYTEAGERYDVRVEGDPAYRRDDSYLDALLVPTAMGGAIPLTNVVSFQDDTGPSHINRSSRQRIVTIYANAAPGYGEGQIGQELLKIVDEVGLPPGVQALPTGQTRIMYEMVSSVLFGFGLAFIFMYLVLAAQFESWLHPFTILTSLPLTLPFAMISIVITGQALNIFSVLGLFVLFGIVKKNAILQIDHTNQLRELHGMPRFEAIMQANRDRLRPILMTTVAFVSGMIPLLMSKGVGSGFNHATAGVTVGGQVLSLLLTLLAVPVFYTLFDDAILWLRKTFLRAPASTPDVSLEGGAS